MVIESAPMKCRQVRAAEVVDGTSTGREVLVDGICTVRESVEDVLFTEIETVVNETVELMVDDTSVEDEMPVDAEELVTEVVDKLVKPELFVED